MAENTQAAPRRTSILLYPNADAVITKLMPILHERNGERPTASDVIDAAIRCLAAQNGIEIEG